MFFNFFAEIQSLFFLSHIYDVRYM